MTFWTSRVLAVARRLQEFARYFSPPFLALPDVRDALGIRRVGKGVLLHAVPTRLIILKSDDQTARGHGAH